MSHHILVLSLLVALATTQGARAVKYTVTNNVASTDGGADFVNEIGVHYSKQTLNSATKFIWRLFQQGPGHRKGVQQVKLLIDDTNDANAAYTLVDKNEVHVMAKYLGSYNGDVVMEFTGIIYHEMTHIWQWRGDGPIGQRAPQGLLEGIADFVRLKANYAPSHWVQPREGNRWDQGYDVMARFLDYCESLRSGFVAELNKRMVLSYSANTLLIF